MSVAIGGWPSEDAEATLTLRAALLVRILAAERHDDVLSFLEIATGDFRDASVGDADRDLACNGFAAREDIDRARLHLWLRVVTLAAPLAPPAALPAFAALARTATARVLCAARGTLSGAA